MRERWVVVGFGLMVLADGGEGEREGDLDFFADFCSSRISVSVRRSMIVLMW